MLEYMGKNVVYDITNQFKCFGAIPAGFIPKVDSRKRYRDKLELFDGLNDMKSRRTSIKTISICGHAAITYVHVCTYLILTPRFYTEKDMLN